MDANLVSAFRGDGSPAEPALLPATVPGVTVAICTYRRPESLLRLLRSILAQDRAPERILIADASPDDATERALRGDAVTAAFGARLTYLRVTAAHRGLTRQRNLILDRAPTSLTAFFDDDVVLLDGCLRELEAVHRADPAVMGVGAYIENQFSPPTTIWRLRRLLGALPSLAPGRYTRSGYSTPWSFLPPGPACVDGDWLPGGATMWRTAAARAERFNEAFEHYGSGEDLDFSLRAAAHGRLVLCGRARVLHLHDASGRPEARELALTHSRNAYRMHRAHLHDRDWRDATRFFYAFALDTAVRTVDLLRPRHARDAARYLAGRLAFVGELLRTGGTGR